MEEKCGKMKKRKVIIKQEESYWRRDEKGDIRRKNKIVKLWKEKQQRKKGEVESRSGKKGK